MTEHQQVQDSRGARVRDYVVVRERAGVWSVTNEVVPRPVAQRLAEVLLALWEELPLSMRQMLPEHVEDAEVALAAFGAVFPKAGAPVMPIMWPGDSAVNNLAHNEGEEA